MMTVAERARMRPCLSRPIFVAMVVSFLMLGSLAIVLADLAPSVRGPAYLAASETTNANGTESLNVTLEYGPTSGPAPLTVFFNDTVRGGTAPYNYSWEFGDGGNGTGQWISHIYMTQGVYTAVLRVVQVSSGAWGIAEGVITVGSSSNNTTGAFTLQFSANPTRGNAPLNSMFLVSASGGVAPYNVSVCPGTGACAPEVDRWNGMNLSYTFTYDQPGNYTATVSGSDAVGTPMIDTIAIVVTSGTPLNVSVLESVPYGPAPLAVGFLASVTGGTAPYTIQWTWGDGTFGSSTNGGIVAHAYLKAGTYVPTIAVRDSANRSVTLTLGTVNVTSSSTGLNATSGLLPSDSGGTTIFVYVAVAAAAAIASGIGVGALLRQRRRAQDANGLARSLETEANRGQPPFPPPEG